MSHWRCRPSTLWIALAVCALSIAILLSVADLGGDHVQASTSGSTGNLASIDTIALDVDITGNTATALGSRQACASIANGDTLQFDVTIDSVPDWQDVDGDGLARDPDTGGIAGFSFNLVYDPTKIKITAKDFSPGVSLMNGPNSNVIDFSEDARGADPLPDTDGDFRVDVPDFGFGAESGAGVLLRLTLEAVGSGLSPLNLDDTITGDGTPDLFDTSANSYTVGTILNGQVAVDQQCPAEMPAPEAGGAADETPTAEEATLGEQVLAEDTVIVVEDASGLEPGTIIAIDNERMRVLSISGNQLTIERGVEGTEAVEHKPGSIVEVTGSPGPGDEQGDALAEADTTDSDNGGMGAGTIAAIVIGITAAAMAAAAAFRYSRTRTR